MLNMGSSASVQAEDKEADKMAVWRFLRDIAPTIFESPENPYINHLMSNAKKKVFNPGTNILEEGKPCDGVYLVVKGQLEVSVKDTCEVERCTVDGEDVEMVEISHVISLVHPGDYVGEVSVLYGLPSTATVSASTRSVLLFFDLEMMAPVVEKQAVKSPVTWMAHRRYISDETCKAIVTDVITKVPLFELWPVDARQMVVEAAMDDASPGIVLCPTDCVVTCPDDPPYLLLLIRGRLTVLDSKSNTSLLVKEASPQTSFAHFAFNYEAFLLGGSPSFRVKAEEPSLVLFLDRDILHSKLQQQHKTLWNGEKERFKEISSRHVTAKENGLWHYFFTEFVENALASNSTIGRGNSCEIAKTSITVLLTRGQEFNEIAGKVVYILEGEVVMITGSEHIPCRKGNALSIDVDNVDMTVKGTAEESAILVLPQTI